MPLVGSQLGRYRILRMLGKGAMGEVYLAEDTGIERQVAIKVIRTDTAYEQNGEGAIEAALDWTSRPWDLAPLILIVQEAGGKSTSLNGRATIYEKSLLSTNGRIHEETLNVLR